MSTHHTHTYNWKYLDVFTVIFVACLLTANIVAVKMVQLGPLILPAGTVVFPISYIVSDVLVEVYGFRAARRVILLGFLANVLMVMFILLAQSMPGAPFWQDQASFERILGFAPRLLLASFMAYLVGSLANALVMARLKPMTNGRLLWLRVILSTILGQGLDSLVFLTVAFAGTLPASAILVSTVSIWLVKTLYEALFTPLTYMVVHQVERREGLRPSATGLQARFEGS